MICIGISFIGQGINATNGGLAPARPYSVFKLKGGGLLKLKSGGYLKLKSIY